MREARGPASMLKTAFRLGGTWFFALVFRLVARPRFLNRNRLREKPSFILASNHISHFDPPCIGSLCGRGVDWLTMDEMFANPMAARVLEWVGCIRVNRFGADRTALRTARVRLAGRCVVGIFPEGGIRAGSTSILEGAAMKPGAAALSLLAGRPVLPCVIMGTDRLYEGRRWWRWRGTPVWMGFGDWIEPPAGLGRDEALAEMTARLAGAFMDLKDRMIREFGLTPDDLPATPQRRKGREVPVS